MRACKRCGTSIEGKHKNKLYCDSCKKVVAYEWNKKYVMRKKPPAEDRYCKRCGELITNRTKNAIYCNSCSKKAMEESQLAYRKKLKKEREEQQIERNCMDCGVDISKLHRNCIRCPSCQHEKNRNLKQVRKKPPAPIKKTKKTKRSNAQAVYDVGNLAKKYHTSYGKIKHDIQTGRVKIEEEDRELAKELGLM